MYVKHIDSPEPSRPPGSTKHLSFIRLRFVSEAAHHLVTKRQKLSVLYTHDNWLCEPRQILNPINVGLGLHGFKRQQKHYFIKESPWVACHYQSMILIFFKGWIDRLFFIMKPQRRTACETFKTKKRQIKAVVFPSTQTPEKVPLCFITTEYDPSWS